MSRHVISLVGGKAIPLVGEPPEDYVVPEYAGYRRHDMAKFDADLLRDLRGVEEVAIRTEKNPKSSVVIWVVVAGDDVFVRSFRGAKGRWYRDLAAGGPATLEFGGRRVAVQAVPANNKAAIEVASREYLAKYASSPYAQAMVQPDLLPTTLRLDPR
jgi:hypothetical protein